MDNTRESTAKTLIRSILKSKKLLQIYPSNNIIYQAAVDEVYATARNYLKTYGEIVVKIKPTELFIDSEEVYHSEQKGDNFAMFFFKEGIREIIFRETLNKKELEEFIKALGVDFSREDTSDDFLMVTWEKNFEGIKIIVDETFLSDYQEGTGDSLNTGNTAAEGLEDTSAEKTLEEDRLISAFRFAAGGSEDTFAGKAPEEDRLKSAYRDGLDKEEVSPGSAGELSAEERAFVIAEMQKGQDEQIWKLSEILIYILINENGEDNFAKIAAYMEDIISYSLKEGSIAAMLAILKKLKGLERRSGVNPLVTEQIRKIILFCVSPGPLAQIGAMLDGKKNIKEEDLIEYAWYFGGDAVKPLITLLESLQTMHARRMVNNALIHIGKENIDAIIEKLSSPVWYVVRNVIAVLRGIGDVRAQDGILGVVGHEHPRVRLEALKAIQDFKGSRAVPAMEAITGFFDDRDSLVRLTAVAVVGNFIKENPGLAPFVRGAIMKKIGEKGFVERDLSEKRAFYESLVCAGDEAVEDFMMSVLKKKGIFGGRKQIEARACAAHYLGLAGSRTALPILEKLMKSSDPLLIEYATIAAQRLKS
jgi:hypothetical protein